MTTKKGHFSEFAGSGQEKGPSADAASRQEYSLPPHERRLLDPQPYMYICQQSKREIPNGSSKAKSVQQHQLLYGGNWAKVEERAEDVELALGEGGEQWRGNSRK